MAAEAPDHHMGGLGRLEEVRIGLSGTDTVGHIDKQFVMWNIPSLMRILTLACTSRCR